MLSTLIRFAGDQPYW